MEFFAQQPGDFTVVGKTPGLVFGVDQFSVPPHVKDSPGSADQRALDSKGSPQFRGQTDRSGVVASLRTVFDRYRTFGCSHVGFLDGQTGIGRVGLSSIRASEWPSANPSRLSVGGAWKRSVEKLATELVGRNSPEGPIMIDRAGADQCRFSRYRFSFRSRVDRSMPRMAAARLLFQSLASRVCRICRASTSSMVSGS